MIIRLLSKVKQVSSLACLVKPSDVSRQTEIAVGSEHVVRDST